MNHVDTEQEANTGGCFSRPVLIPIDGVMGSCYKIELDHETVHAGDAISGRVIVLSRASVREQAPPSRHHEYLEGST